MSKPFLSSYRANFDTLKRACENGHLAMVECLHVPSSKLAAVVCAIGFKDGQYEIVPLARMLEGNPFDEYQPPDPNGGFRSEV